jgi:hypothetical protein
VWKICAYTSLEKRIVHNLNDKRVKDQWRWALHFFDLTPRTAMHPSQLLAPLLSSLFCSASSGEGDPASSLLQVAKACVRSTAKAECPAQAPSVTAAFDELMDAEPSRLVSSLLASHASVRPALHEMRSQVRVNLWVRLFAAPLISKPHVRCYRYEFTT